MRRPPDQADPFCMAAILFLVVILGFLAAGRAQALAAEYRSESLLRFQLWQFLVAALLLVALAAHVAMIAKVIGLVATAAGFGVSVVKARHAHDVDDLHF